MPSAFSLFNFFYHSLFIHRIPYIKRTIQRPKPFVPFRLSISFLHQFLSSISSFNPFYHFRNASSHRLPSAVCFHHRRVLHIGRRRRRVRKFKLAISFFSSILKYWRLLLQQKDFQCRMPHKFAWQFSINSTLYWRSNNSKFLKWGICIIL